MNNDKTKSIVGYIVFICALIFLFQKENSRDVKFHCAQSIVIFIGYIIISFILGIVKANNGENPELPVIGDIAKSIFGKQIEG